jgi:hypothetical protein
VAAPANDNIASATVLTGTTTSGNNSEATVESGEVRCTGNGTTGFTVAFKTVWFRWVAPSGTLAQIDTTGSAFDSYLTMWQAKTGVTDPVALVADIEPVASNDDGGGSGTSRIFYGPVSGRTYYVQISGFSGTDFGNYVLNYPTPGAGAAPDPPPRRPVVSQTAVHRAASW